MKRKLFNAALFAAVLVAAPVSTFVSCADYDSDIENLQNQNNDLEALVLQKEEVLNGKIAALEAQNKELEAAYKAADEALKQALADNKTEILAEIATCKAECKAAIDNLQTQIDALKKSLGELQEKHDKDVKTLLEADKVLQQNIDAANTAIKELETRLDARIKALETLTATHTTEIENLKKALEAVKEDIEKVRKEFAAADEALKKELQGKIDELWKQVNANKTAIENEVTARENAIKELTAVVNANKKACDDAVAELQKKDGELAKAIDDLTKDFNTYKDLNDKEVQALKDRMAAVEGQVSVNTKAILDLAARVADLYNGLDQLEAALEAAKAAQELVDAAQNARIDQLFAEKADLTYVNEQVNILTNSINKVADDLAVLTARVNTNEGDIRTLKSQLSALQQEVTDAKKKYDEEIAALKSKYATLDGKIDQVKLELQRNIDAVEEAYKAADVKIWEKLGKLDEAIADLNKLVEKYAKELSAEVKGFVLLPDSYYEGIQAIEGNVFAFHEWNVAIAMKPVQKIKGEEILHCPEVVANYHVNPSTATLSEDTQYYSYTVEDRTNRGNNTELEPVIKEVAQDGGLLSVTMSLTDPKANKTDEFPGDFYSDVTVMALQYKNPAAKAENPVVTSDYAVLYLNKLLEVNLLDKDGKCHIPDLFHHKWVEIVWGVPVERICPPKVVEVKYDETQDILDLITTQFGQKEPSTTLPEGFSYRYTVVGSGDEDGNNGGGVGYFNATDIADGIVNPQLPNGEQATVACIGKNIIVRVDVMLGDKVAEVGFFQFYIVGDAIVETADAVTTTADYDINCDETATALQATLSAENVWKKVVKETGLSEKDAMEDYSFCVEANSEALAQYTKNEEGKYVPGKGIGTVELNENGTLTWTILYNELPSTPKFPLTTYVLVRSNKQVYNKESYNEFYFPLTWEPNDVEIWGETTGGVETVTWEYDKISNQWQKNGDEYEIRLYPDLNTQGLTPYTYKLSRAIYNTTVTLDNAGRYTNGAQFKLENGHYVFVDNPNVAARKITGISGTVYTLKVSDDGSKLLATAATVATRATNDAEYEGEIVATITPDGEINLENNAFTRDMINNYERTQLALGQTLAAHVSYEVETCAGAVKVVKGDFDVRFIKPLTVTAKEIEVQDADGINGVVTIDLGKNLECFNGYSFFDHPEYYKNFNVRISSDPDEWTTNYNGGNIEETYLGTYKDIYNNFGCKAENDGRLIITYTNNTAVVNDYKVRVPFKLSHNWLDEHKYYVTIVVKHTAGNSNRK